jgi:hypothetical protein
MERANENSNMERPAFADGNYISYIVGLDKIGVVEANLRMDWADSQDEDYTRMARKHQKRTSKRHRNKYLRRELAIILGPNMCANDVISGLELVIEQIREQGLLVGFDTNPKAIYDPADQHQASPTGNNSV